MKQMLIGLVSAGLLFGCVAISAHGDHVQYVTHSEAPAACKLLGEVDVGASNSKFQQLPSDIYETKILMRNQCAEMGGNFLVIDAILTASTGHSGPNSTFVGSGRAYQCPQDHVDATRNDSTQEPALNKSP